MGNQRIREWFLFLLNIASHLPFLKVGYGREEDAWSQALNARLISESGVYEVSRLPGHPVYELLLAMLWPLNHSYLFYNFLSTMASALAVVYFYKICLHVKAPRPTGLALTLSFIPVFFIAGTYTIDYNFALLFILISFYKLLKGKLIWAGVFLGLATGFRISSAFLLFPWMIMYNGKHSLNFILRLGLAATITAMLCYLPPFLKYGFHFLDFHKPPYAGLAKILFKLSFGVWGTILITYLGVASIYQLVKPGKIRIHFNDIRYFIWGLIVILAFQLFVFFRLPFKSEFFIPALPFLILLFSKIFSAKQLYYLPIAAVLSCFLIGFDYKSDYRGSTPSPVHLQFQAGKKNLYVDILKGPVTIDHGKRLTKYSFVSSVLDWMKNRNEPTYLIAGWYWPQIQFRTWEQDQVTVDYYSDESTLKNIEKQGPAIFYLPEINEANAKIKGHYLADSLGTLLIP